MKVVKTLKINFSESFDIKKSNFQGRCYEVLNKFIEEFSRLLIKIKLLICQIFQKLNSRFIKKKSANPPAEESRIGDNSVIQRPPSSPQPSNPPVKKSLPSSGQEPQKSESHPSSQPSNHPVKNSLPSSAHESQKSESHPSSQPINPTHSDESRKSTKPKEVVYPINYKRINQTQDLLSSDENLKFDSIKIKISDKTFFADNVIHGSSTHLYFNKATVVLETDCKIYEVGLHTFLKMPLGQIYLNANLDFSIEVKDKNNQFKKIDLPKDISEKIINHLRYPMRGRSFSPLNFINHCFGQNEDDPIPNNFNIVEEHLLESFIKKADKKNFVIGDVIALTEEEQDAGSGDYRIIHVALYLGNGLCLWQSHSSSLLVSSLEEMAHLFQTKRFFLMRSKNDLSPPKLNDSSDDESNQLNKVKTICPLFPSYPADVGEKNYSKTDFYKGQEFKTIKIRICSDKIFKDKSLNFYWNKASAFLETDQEILKVGLHTFPKMPLGQKCVPDKDNLNFTIEIKDKNNQIKNIELPKSVNEKIVSYLINQKYDPDFSCYQFVNHCFGKDPEVLWEDNFNIIENILLESFDKKADKKNFSVGDAILLTQEEMLKEKTYRTIHSALYLGNELCLWHVGPSFLCVSSLEEMARLYKTRRFFVMRPKSPSS